MSRFQALDDPESPTHARARSASIEDCTGLTEELQKKSSVPVEVPVCAAEDDDDWCTVPKASKRDRPRRSEEAMMSASPAYTTFAYSAEEGDFGDTRDQAKTGGGLTDKSQQKHSVTHNASLRRSYSIEKRDAQRAASKR